MLIRAGNIVIDIVAYDRVKGIIGEVQLMGVPVLKPAPGRYTLTGGVLLAHGLAVAVCHAPIVDGKGTLLDVGCGSGALSIRAALTWPEAQVTGIDYWGVAYGYGQPMCEKNAESEGVGFRCAFRHGDANKLDFPDESFDAVVSNYVYHNVMGADKQALLLETLRVLKKGGVFALNDEMKPHMYGNMSKSCGTWAMRTCASSTRPRRSSAPAGGRA